jgi:hypothetical protein
MPTNLGMIVVADVTMKTICMALFLVCTSVSLTLAQRDSTRYEYGLPVTEDDTATDFPSTDLYPPKNYQQLNAAQLPRRVLKALRKQHQYRGWEQGGYILIRTQKSTWWRYREAVITTFLD